MKALALSEECVPSGACDQIRADCNLATLIRARVNVVSVACIISDGDGANLFAFAVGVEMKAMASDPGRKNRV